MERTSRSFSPHCHEYRFICGVDQSQLVSDIAKTNDVLGWFSPVIVTAKILLQHLWEERLQWDDPVPDSILAVWSRWKDELPLLSSHHIPRYYFNKNTSITSLQLHGFSDASQLAYAGVVYLRAVDNHDVVTTSLVLSKTKVAPLKKLTIPRLELYGTLVLAQALISLQENTQRATIEDDLQAQRVVSHVKHNQLDFLLRSHVSTVLVQLAL